MRLNWLNTQTRLSTLRSLYTTKNNGYATEQSSQSVVGIWHIKKFFYDIFIKKKKTIICTEDAGREPTKSDIDIIFFS